MQHTPTTYMEVHVTKIYIDSFLLLDKIDSTMDEEYVRQRFQITLDDPCN